MSIYRVRTVFTGVAGTPWYSNLYFAGLAEGGTDTNVVAVHDAAADFWGSLASAIIDPVDWVVQGDVARINPTTGEVTSFDSVPAVTNGGNATAEALPFATQGLIALNTAGVRRSRRVVGHIYVPGMTEANNVAGQPSAALRTLLATSAADLRRPALDVLPVVWARPRDTSSGFLPGAAFPVTSSASRPGWAVLRSRRD